MTIQLTTASPHEITADWLIVGIPEAEQFPAPLDELNQSLDGLLSRLKTRGDLTGGLGETVAVPEVPALAAERLLLVGLGKSNELNVGRLDRAMMTAARFTSEKKAGSVAVLLEQAVSGEIPLTTVLQTAASAMRVGAVGQDLYRSEPARKPFETVSLLVGESDDNDESRAAVERGQVIGDAINLTRELVNRSPHEIFPESFAARAEQLSHETGLACDILDNNRLDSEQMQAMLAVAQGSDRPPRLVVLEHRGGGDEAPTLAICGKGVTFDSGGLSLKPSEGMATMKSDMAGAATVLGVMSAISKLRLPVNVIGYMGLVENMPSGTAYKLGDVLKARNGVTIEVLNTDAEGRLVLADVLAYAVDNGCDNIIDLATLTGACVVALGEDVTGSFTNNREWCQQVMAAARSVGEDVWELPMFELYNELIKSEVADIKNIGGRWGGAITAAKFLERFVGDKPWVHLDIAGPSFASSNKPHREGGATGCMVRTLIETAERFTTESN